MSDKEYIYKFLDRHYPIKDGVIDMSFNKVTGPMIYNIFGVENISFNGWVRDRIGPIYAMKFDTIIEAWYDLDNNNYIAALKHKPSVIREDGTKEWYDKKNQYHSYNGQPAVIYSSGNKEWYQNGKLHRNNDQPAAIYPDGTKYWYQNGKRHRDNDKPAIIYPNGNKYWFINGKRHRENDKPAVIYPDGGKEFWLNGRQYYIPTPVHKNKKIKI